MLPFHKGDGRPFIVRKQERNALCKCGSGKKAKKCCGKDEQFYCRKPKNTTPAEQIIIDKEATKDL